MNSHLLTGMILLPFLGAVLQAVANPGAPARWLALGASVASTLLGGVVLTQVAPGISGPQLVDQLPWIGSYAIHYDLAVDGTSVLVLLLVSAVFPVLLASEWERPKGARGLYALILILQGALIGAACAQDLFLLFFFWSLSSLPIFFLVGIWGGAKKEQAAFRVLVTNTLGNTLLFAAFVLIYYAKDPHTFLIRDLISAGGIPHKLISVAGLEVGISEVAFFFVCLGLALRAPVWPLHGWFFQLANEAPPSVFVAVSAVIVPVAVMIFARLSNLLFPEIMESGAIWVLCAGVINLLVGSVAILSQRRLSALIAHLSLAHLGLALVGLGSQNASALVGVIYHQLGFGLALAAFGLLLGGLSVRAGIVELSSSPEGLAERAPTAAAITGLAMGCFIGVPGLSGFVGQSLIVMGGYSSHPAVLFIIGVATVLVAYSLFGMFRQLFLGGGERPEGGETRGGELLPRERLFLIPLVALIILLGFYPKPFIDWVRPTAFALVSGSGEPTSVAPAVSAGESPVVSAPAPKASPSPQAPPPPEKKGN